MFESFFWYPPQADKMRKTYASLSAWRGLQKKFEHCFRNLKFLKKLSTLLLMSKWTFRICNFFRPILVEYKNKLFLLFYTYEKSWALRDGFRAYPMIRDPKTVPIPAPDPATPTVAAPAPMNLAAVSISRLQTDMESGLKLRVI